MTATTEIELRNSIRKLTESQRFLRQMVAAIVEQYGKDGALTIHRAGLTLGDRTSNPEILTSCDDGLNTTIRVKKSC